MTNEHALASKLGLVNDPQKTAENTLNCPSSYPTSTLVQNVACSANAAQAALEKWGMLPQELRERRQWCLAAPNKIPLTINADSASSTNPETWSTFEDVAPVALEKGLNIGYMLAADDPFACIDIDWIDEETQKAKSKVVDPSKWTTQEQCNRFESIVSLFDSYTERSQSGKGLHIWVKGKIGTGKRRDGIEVYSQERFIICTGQVYKNKPIASNQPMLEQLVAGISRHRQETNIVEISIDLNDEPHEILVNVARANEDELGKLFRGEWEGRQYPSQSEADLALVKLLLPYCSTYGETWATFRQSELGKRGKAERNDYALSTIQTAIKFQSENKASIEHGRQTAEILLSNYKLKITQRFPLLSEDDLMNEPPISWLVKNIIPQESFGVIYGDSGTYKSFLVLDLLAHIANGYEWFGYKVKQTPCIYVPLEGQGGLPRRVQAWTKACEKRTELKFITTPINLRDVKDRNSLVDGLIENGWNGGVLCIDTLAQAGAGIDENSSEGMGEMIAIFQELKQRLKCTILVVHHSGKTADKGMRGHSSLKASLDFGIKCSKDNGTYDAKFELEKVKDGESGIPHRFAMIQIPIGFDEDNEPITSLFVAPVHKTLIPNRDETIAQDNEFVWDWINSFNKRNEYISGRVLETMREAHGQGMTQKRLRDAITRLKEKNRLTEEKVGRQTYLRCMSNSP